MTIHYNRESERSNRRRLRQSSTQAEEILWECLRDRKLSNVKFRRQYSVGRYVIDFYSPKNKLAVELDGDVHLNQEAKDHDEIRDGYLKRFGIKIIRINNEVVIDNTQLALKIIRSNLPSPLLAKERGQG